MVVGRALRASGCPNCRVSIVRSFASLAGPAIRPLRPSPRVQYATSLPRPRFFSAPLERHGNESAQETRSLKADPGVAKDAEELPEKEAGSGDAPTVPWYLQAESSQRAPQTLPERQRLPELPESPPAVLQPILQQLSLDLGLDDLQLLDLRKLDPPPALGTNLIMVFGTARSEKHLHVSADRFCRWLRSTYRLRPSADGLLGRNELKLKLRRKARRAKLLGSAADENEDDGVRTGWICVDVGVVEIADPTGEEASRQDFVGFGRRTDGVTIVVQMLVEEKREMMDLEGLWGGILKRGLQQQSAEIEGADNTEVPNPNMADAENEQVSLPQMSPTTGISRGTNPSPISSQRRGFHTSAFRRLPGADAAAAISPPDIPGQMATTIAYQQSTDLDSLRQQLREYFVAGNFKFTEEFFQPFAKDIPQLQNNGWRELLLHELQRYIKSVPKEHAWGLLRVFGDSGIAGPASSYFYPVPPSASEAEVKACLDIACYSNEILVGGYGPMRMIRTFEQAQRMAVPISAAIFLRAIQCIMNVRSLEIRNSGSHIEVCLKLLQMMHDQGHNVLSPEICLTMLEGLAYETPSAHVPRIQHCYVERRTTSPRQQRFHAILMSQDMPLPEDEIRIRLMDLYARNIQWAEFWDIWSMAARRGLPQSPRMYAFMFRKMAEVVNQTVSIRILRRLLPEMDAEEPRVALEGDIADAVMALVRIAEPHVEAQVKKDPAARGEWINIWRRASQGLKK